MGDLGMVLETVEVPVCILDGCNGSLGAPGHHLETLRQADGLVSVAHPDSLKLAGCAIERGVALDLDVHLAILLLVSGGDLAAELLDEQLHAVADAEDGDAVLLDIAEKAVGERRGVGEMDGVGSSGEDDGAGGEGGDGGEGGGAGEAEGEHGEVADAAGDEVGVLGAVVEDEDEGAGRGGAAVAGEGHRYDYRRKGLGWGFSLQSLVSAE